MTISPGNAQDIGARKEQQDAFGFSDPTRASFVKHAGVVAVVADGMGGLAHGDQASKTAVHSFLRAYEAKSPSEPVQEALERCLREANRAVCSLAAEAAAKPEVGTTLAAAVIHDGHLHWVSAGDTRIYLVHEGRALQMTRDHIYLNELEKNVSSGRISRADAIQNPSRGDLTSYLGLPDLKEVDSSPRPVPVDTKDLVLVCTDGLYRALTEDEIATSVRGDPHGSCELLMQRALAKRQAHQDNITVVALKRGASPLAASRRRTQILAAALTACAVIAGATGMRWYLNRGIKALPKHAQITVREPGAGEANPGDKEAPSKQTAVAGADKEGRSTFESSPARSREAASGTQAQAASAALAKPAPDTSAGAAPRPLTPATGGLIGNDLAPPIAAVPAAPPVPLALLGVPDAPPRPPKPSIGSFTVDQYEVPAGKPVRFSWNITGEVTRVQLNDKMIAKWADGNVLEHPFSDTDYRLYVSGPGGEVPSQDIHVKVLTGPIHIVSFGASPQTVRKGLPTLLQWRVEGAVETVTLNGRGVRRIGDYRVTPDKTTEYTLRAEGGTGGVQTWVLKVKVNRAAAPVEITKFTTEHGTIAQGEKVSLQWKTKGDVSKIVLNNKVLNPEASGCEDYPLVRKDYRLVIYGPPGTEPAGEAVTVDVTPNRNPAKHSLGDRIRSSITGARISTCENPPAPVKR